MVVAIAVAALAVGWRTAPRSAVRAARPQPPQLPAQRRASVRKRRRRERAARDALPDLVDLVLIGVQAGEPPVAALLASRAGVSAALHEAVDDVLGRANAGTPAADAVVALVDRLGPSALALVDALRTSARTGAALGPMLDRLADDARHQRRRLAEAKARELPVRLAFPLVCCTLPAFVLVAIVPLLVAALASLRQG
jgi:tight adherence protein C